MRILYVNQDAGIDWCGHAGGATHIQSVVRAMRRLGHHVQILVRKPPEYPCAPDLDIPIYLQPEDVPWGYFDLVYERYSLWGELSLRCCLPWHLEINAPLIEEQMRYRTPIDVTRAAQIKDAVCRRVQRIITVSASLTSYITEDARSKITVVPNCVDRQMFFPRPLPKSFAFGYVGSMRPWHDLDTPLESFTQLQGRYPEITFHVVGSSAREKIYREKYTSPQIRFHGLVPPLQVPDLLKQITCGIALFTSDAPDYFSPLKIKEYLATHRTVLTHPKFVEFPNVTEGVEGVASTIDAMERQIHLDRNELRFPKINDWSDSITFL
jgi:glycosyltransferase involved in cell wall biosynthesis